jgi:hypothetical protein
MNYLAPQVQSNLKVNGSKKLMACALINSIQFLIEYVFIMKNENGCRLVVKHNGIIMTDKQYDTIRGAKVAFSRLYGRQRWKGQVKAQWSHLFEPDTEWLACILYFYNHPH